MPDDPPRPDLRSEDELELETISVEDLGLIRVTDSPDEAAAIVSESLRLMKLSVEPLKPSRMLGEAGSLPSRGV